MGLSEIVKLEFQLPFYVYVLYEREGERDEELTGVVWKCIVHPVHVY